MTNETTASQPKDLSASIQHAMYQVAQRGESVERMHAAVMAVIDSQPKSIGDDALVTTVIAHCNDLADCAFALQEHGGFAATAQEILIAVTELRAACKLRAPAAQASATIQAAPEGEAYGNKIAKVIWEIRKAKSLAWRDSLVEQLIELIEPSPGPAAIQEPVMVAEPVPKIQITLRQALGLVNFFGGHDADVTVTESANGLVAFCTEYPEEGSEFLGATEVDEELARIGVPRTPISAHVDLIKAGALRQFKHNDGSPGLVFAYDKVIVDHALAAPMVADPAGVALELTDEGIVKVLASFGIDSTESKYGFDALQVSTTVPSIRRVVETYLAATVKAVPSEALEGCEQCLHTYCLSSEICRHCGDVNGTQGYKGGKLAAPLADKTGGAQ